MNTETLPEPQGEQAVAAVKFEKIVIETDGTRKGTVIKVNGKEVPNMSSLSFSFYDSSYCPICLTYTVTDPEYKAGTLGAYTTYRLRCPEQAMASKAEASTDEQVPTYEFEFNKTDFDVALANYTGQTIRRGNSNWSQLK